MTVKITNGYAILPVRGQRERDYKCCVSTDNIVGEAIT